VIAFHHAGHRIDIGPWRQRKPRQPLDRREHQYGVPEPKEAKGAA